MNRPLFFSRASIRTVLLTVLVVLGGWGVLSSLQRIYDNFLNYQQSRNLSTWASYGAGLLSAAQHFAYERGRSAVVLRASIPITRKDRSFIDERRKLADTSLSSVLDRQKNLPDIGCVDLIKKWKQVQELRKKVDQDAVLSYKSRDPQLPAAWISTASSLILSIQQSINRLVGYFRPGEITTSLTLLASSALELRISAGTEASTIAQAVSARKYPADKFINHIYELRGRENRLWDEIDWLAEYANIPDLQNKAKEIKQHHMSVFRPLQDRALKDLKSGLKSSVPIEILTGTSLATLDGISDLTTLTAENAQRLAKEGIARSRSTLIINILWSFSIMLLMALSIIYVGRFIVKPLEKIDTELHRIGALSDIGERGNEIHRLNASTIELEKALLELRTALASIKQLSGLLPICSNCKKIRDDKGYWQQVDEYVSQRSDTTFSHGLCPDCIRKMYPDMADKIIKKLSDK